MLHSPELSCYTLQYGLATHCYLLFPDLPIMPQSALPPAYRPMPGRCSHLYFIKNTDANNTAVGADRPQAYTMHKVDTTDTVPWLFSQNLMWHSSSLVLIVLCPGSFNCYQVSSSMQQALPFQFQATGSTFPVPGNRLRCSGCK